MTRAPGTRRLPVVALAWVLLLAAGCPAPHPGPGPDGGGMGGGASAGGGAGGGAVGEWAASLQRILEHAHGAPGRGTAAWRAELLGFMQGQPGVAASGSSPDGVWALFSNGVPLLLLDRDLLGPAADGGMGKVDFPPVGHPHELPGAGKTQVPSSRQAIVVDTRGPAFAPHRHQVEVPLQEQGYEVTRDPGTVESLRSLPAAGVFFFAAHGGQVDTTTYDDADNVLRDPEGEPLHGRAFGVMTSTPYDPSQPLAYERDLFAGRLGVADALDHYLADGVTPVNASRYFVTDRFARKYWSFPQDALVWIDACSGQSDAAAAFRDACLKKNIDDTAAGLYVSWTEVTLSSAGQAASAFMVPRLLGTNDLRFPTEDPPQRAFTYAELWPDLHARGLDTSVANGVQSVLVYTASGSSQFGMLAPSIKYVLVDELHDEAILVGSFGKRVLDEGFVRIQDVDVAIHDWTEDRIHVALPRSGPGSSGPVVVTVRRHDSNARNITEWKLGLNYRFQMADQLPCSLEGPVTLRFRADVGEYREQPGTALIRPVRHAIATRDSVASLTASGTHVDTQAKCSNTWSGTGQLLPTFFGSTGPQMMAMATLDGFNGRLILGLAVAGPPQVPWTITQVCRDGSGSGPLVPTFGTLDLVWPFGSPLEDGRPELPLPAYPAMLDAELGLPADTYDQTVSTLTVHLDWPDSPARWPPDAGAAR